ILSGIAQKELEAFGECLAAHEDNIVVKVFEEKKVEDILQLVYTQKAKIHSLVPRTESLEDLFVGMVKKQ
ncbi:MAG: hypothetical protein KAT15_19675, partial [Bacteroidales bacterium]|nr:hypothetical protein [Bacteroidales bacterium]